jgi:hypothetical protein
LCGPRKERIPVNSETINQVQIVFVFVNVTDSSPHFLISTRLTHVNKFVRVVEFVMTLNLILNFDEVGERIRPIEKLREILGVESAILPLFDEIS